MLTGREFYEGFNKDELIKLYNNEKDLEKWKKER